MSALGVAVSVGGVAFILACVALLRWCDRRSELEAQRCAREDLEGYVSDLRRDAHLRVHIGERLVHPLERQYRDVLRARIDGQITRDFWAGASPPSPWPEDPNAPESVR